MKLFTEKQLRDAYNEGVNDGYSYSTVKEDKLINSLTPIELPSDEEIEKMVGWGGDNDNAINGALWMKEQILNQNK